VGEDRLGVHRQGVAALVDVHEVVEAWHDPARVLAGVHRAEIDDAERLAAQLQARRIRVEGHRVEPVDGDAAAGVDRLHGDVVSGVHHRAALVEDRVAAPRLRSGEGGYEGGEQDDGRDTRRGKNGEHENLQVASRR